MTVWIKKKNAQTEECRNRKKLPQSTKLLYYMQIIRYSKIIEKFSGIKENVSGKSVNTSLNRLQMMKSCRHIKFPSFNIPLLMQLYHPRKSTIHFDYKFCAAAFRMSTVSGWMQKIKIISWTCIPDKPRSWHPVSLFDWPDLFNLWTCTSYQQLQESMDNKI